MGPRRASQFGSVDAVPKTLADYKLWLINKFPRTKIHLDIKKEVFELLRDNQIKNERLNSDQ